MENSPEVSQLEEKLQDTLLKNDNIIKTLESYRDDIDQDKNRTVVHLKNHYKNIHSKLDEVYQETLDEITQEHSNLKEDLHRKERKISLLSLDLWPKLVELRKVVSESEEGSIKETVDNCKSYLGKAEAIIDGTKYVDKVTLAFRPNLRFEKMKMEDFGYVDLSNSNPSDLTLRLLTSDHRHLPNNATLFQVGHKVICGIEGDLSKENLRHLELSVKNVKNSSECGFAIIASDANIITFSFETHLPGVYRVLARLLGQPITASPLYLTALQSLQEISKLLTLIKENTFDEDKDHDSEISQKPLIKSSMDHDNLEEDNTGDDLSINVTPVEVDVANSVTNSDEQTFSIGRSDEKQMIECNSANIQEIKESFLNDVGDGVEEHPVLDAEVSNDGRDQRLWNAGEDCVAMWEKDGVWYNAQILEIKSDGSVLVKFTDYGNSDVVSSLVKDADSIPKDEVLEPQIDENVSMINMMEKDKQFEVHPSKDRADTTNYAAEEKILNIEDNKDDKTNENETPVEVTTGNESNESPVREKCFARWNDEVWYNALVQKRNDDGSFKVVFTDYGNTDTVEPSNIVKNRFDIPEPRYYTSKSHLDWHLLNSEIKEATVKITIGEDREVVNRNKAENENKINDENLDIPSEIISDLGDNSIRKEASVIERLCVGETCVAQWSVDQTWYNATIKEVHHDQSITVTFTDYGNTDIVNASQVVKEYTKIPDKVGSELIDENVLFQSPGDTVMEDVSQGQEDDQAKINSHNESISMEKSSSAKTRSKTLPSMPRPLKRIAMKMQEKLTINQIDIQNNNAQQEKNIEILHHEELKLNVGDPCLAKWNYDGIWYNSIVNAENADGSFSVTFTDYGNEDVINRRQIVANYEELSKLGEKFDVDQNVFKLKLEKGDCIKQIPTDENITKDLAPEISSWDEGDVGIAKWSQDNIWYNARIDKVNVDGSFLVCFVDYSNSEVVQFPSIVKNVECIDKKETLDFFVKSEAEQLENDFEYDSCMSAEKSSKSSSEEHPASNKKASINIIDFFIEAPDGTNLLQVQKILTIGDIKRPMGITVLQNKNIVIGSTGNDEVRVFSPDGNVKFLVKSPRLFKRPSHMTTLSTGEFVVRDDLGLQLFSQEGNFIKHLGESSLDKCYGVAEDGDGFVLTINYAKSRTTSHSQPGLKGKGGLTDLGEMDIFYIDPKTGSVVKRIELIDIIQNKSKSKCRSLNYHQDTVYIMDIGLDQVYSLNTRDNQASVIGTSGSGEAEFSDPAGMALDTFGNKIVADSKNHRLQVFDSSNKFVGLVQADAEVQRPSGVYLDAEVGDLYVLNYWSDSMVKYRLALQ